MTIDSFMLVSRYYLKLLKVLFIRPVILAPLHTPYIGVLSWPAFCLGPTFSLAASLSSGGAPCPPAVSSPCLTLREINESCSLQSQGQRRGFE